MRTREALSLAKRGQFRHIKRNCLRLGEGWYREVYRINRNTVLKIDLDLGYSSPDADEAGTCGSCCRTEAFLWESVQGSKYAQYLCTVKGSGPGWILMECLATIAEEADWSECTGKQVETVAFRLNIDDVHPQNWGFRRDGSWAICDYGSKS